MYSRKGSVREVPCPSWPKRTWNGCADACKNACRKACAWEISMRVSAHGQSQPQTAVQFEEARDQGRLRETRSSGCQDPPSPHPRGGAEIWGVEGDVLWQLRCGNLLQEVWDQARSRFAHDFVRAAHRCRMGR